MNTSKLASILFMTMTFAILVSGCGGAGKSTASFEVNTGALTATNTTFEGGLVVMGESGNQRFVLPISQSSGKGNKVTIELARGKWTFTAVAWGGVSSPFSGTMYCDDVNISLDKNEQTVDLKPTTSKCLGSQFGAGVYNNGTSILPIKVITCGWLYEDPSATTQVGATTLPSYCSSLPSERKEFASSVKIEVPTIMDDKVSTGISYCLTSPSLGTFSSSRLFPVMKLPAQVKLFQNSSCNESDPDDVKGNYFFPQGLATAVAEHDHVLNNISGSTNLFLPFNRIKRGYSKFISILPQITCNGANCTPLPISTPGGEDLVSIDFQDLVLIDAPTGNQRCSNLSGISSGDFTVSFEPSTDCRMENGRLIGRIGLSNATSGAITLNWADATAAVVRNVFLNNSYRTYDQLFSGFGLPISGLPVITPIRNSFKTFQDDDDNKTFGVLSEVRDLFEVDGPAGVLGNVSCAAGVTKDKRIAMVEEGVKQEYQVIFRDSDKTVSSIEQDGTHSIGQNYEKKIILRQKNAAGVYITKATVDFFCGYKMGIFETQDSRDGRDFQKIVYWNTESSSNGKVEAQLSSSKYVTAAVLDEYSSEIFKISNPGDSSKAVLNKFSLQIRKNGANYDYSSLKNQSDLFAGNAVRFLEVANQVSLSTPTNPVFSSTIASALPVLDLCLSHSTPSFNTISATACTAYLSGFSAGITWNTLLPGNGIFTPNSSFSAAE